MSCDGVTRGAGIEGSLSGGLMALTSYPAARLRLYRRRKEQEINDRPALRDMGRSYVLGDFLRDLMDSRKPEVSPGTLDLNRQTARQLIAYFGEKKPVLDIGKADARAFKTALANGRLVYINKRKVIPKPSTVGRAMREATTFFNRLVEDDHILVNPFAGLAKVVKPEKDWHHLSREEYARIIEAAPSIGWRVLISLCRMEGLRRGEALNLEWSNINWSDKTLTVIGKDDWETKNKKSRVVPIFPEVEKLLLEAYDTAKPGAKKIVAIKGNTNLIRDYFKICKRAGVAEYGSPFHTLRKNCATDWAGIFPMHVVSKWLGHSSLDVTKTHYLSVSKNDYEKASSMNFWGDIASNRAKQENNNALDNQPSMHKDIEIKEI